MYGVDFEYQYKRKTPLFSMWVSMHFFLFLIFFFYAKGVGRESMRVFEVPELKGSRK